MSSLQREDPANPDREASGQLQKLRKQLQVRGEELQQRDSAMQQLLRGAERIEEAQKATLRQLATTQLEVGCASSPRCIAYHITHSRHMPQATDIL